jgi:Arc/MetJ family transcription regulator
VYKQAIKYVSFRAASKLRTNIVIDDQLMEGVMQASGASTKREVVEKGLCALVLLNQQRLIKNFRGQLPWDADLELMRMDRSA